MRSFCGIDGGGRLPDGSITFRRPTVNRRLGRIGNKRAVTLINHGQQIRSQALSRNHLSAGTGANRS